MTSSGAGEHHSPAGRRSLPPRCFWAAAGERTKRIKLGTGVVSLPYHHPFNVAQRMVQLDHMTGGAHLRLGPRRARLRRAHARHRSDDPARPPGRSDRVIRRLFNGERVTVKATGSSMNDAALQIRPPAGGDAVRRRLADFALGMRSPANTDRHHLARLDVDARA